MKKMTALFKYNDIQILTESRKEYYININHINTIVGISLGKSSNNFKIYEKKNYYQIYDIKNYINIVYEISEEDKSKSKGIFKFFGYQFIKNNRKNCCIEYKNSKYELNEYYKIDKYDNNKKIRIKLKGIKNVIDMTGLFCECTSLKSLPNLTNWDTTKVEYMNVVFSSCSSLKSLTYIYIWNTNNLKEINSLFSGCSSLESLPDISKWNTTNLLDIGGLFRDCSSLKSLPDLSKWKTAKVDNMMEVFSGCSSLE